MSPTMNVPCILIDNENFLKWWPIIIKCLTESDFIAIDLELSGLGSKDVYAPQIDERYKAIREVALTRTILSMGIACFQLNSKKGFFKNSNKKLKKLSEQKQFLLDQINDCLDKDDDDDNQIFNEEEDEDNGNNDDNQQENDENFYCTSNVFNFLTLNMQEFIMETRSMKFLAQQGFDFNELSLKGIPFYPGNDHPSSTIPPIPSLRRLINLIISLKLPVLFHNGLIDLAFFYQNFYCEMPKTLEMFLADLYEMFPNGIFDTKFIANAYLPCSYLEYLFQFSQRTNYFRKLKNTSSLVLEFSKYDDNDNDNENFTCDIRIFDLSPKIMQLSLDVNNKICEHYAKSGWCEKSDQCKDSHNIDLILDLELKLKKDKKSKELVNLLENYFENNNNSNNSETVSSSSTSTSGKSENGDNNNDNDVDNDKLNKNDDELNLLRKSGCHHAGNDAFMTGYYFIFNHILHSKPNQCTFKEFRTFNDLKKQFKNKIFLAGKPRPLNIMKSSYGKCSENHLKKFRKIKEKVDWT